MRKFLWMVAVGGLVLALAAPAMALDFKFGGEYRVRFYAGDNQGGNNPAGLFDHNNPNRDLRGAQLRVRPRFDVSDDNGNITATLRLEIGDIEFGNGGGAQGVTNGTNQTPGSARVGNGAGGSLGADGVNVETKWAYVDFAMPANIPLRFRAGLMPWYLPKGIIVDDDVIGVRAYGTYAPVSYEFAWFRTSCGPNANPGTPPAGSSGSAQCVGGVATTDALGNPISAPSGTAQQTTDNNYDWYQLRTDVAIAPWLNPGVYGLYGMNKATTFGFSTPAQAWFIGLTATGKVGTVSYDFDALYGSAEGGPAGTNVGNNGVLASASNFVKMQGWMLDGGVHIPIGPITLNLVGSFASGDKRNGGNSEAFPYISPSWNGAGGQYELIGSGGNFDAIDDVQDYPTNLWMAGASVEYRPVKALWLRLVYGYAGFVTAKGNCAVVTSPQTACFGPSYAKLAAANGGTGTGQFGQEISLRANYDMWTNFQIQGAAGILIPKAGSPATEYVLQLFYSF